MTRRAEQLEKFLELCRCSSFRHREEILLGIESGAYSLDEYHEGKVSATSLLDIYAKRARRMSTKIGKHAKRLKRDIQAFLKELGEERNDTVHFWSVSVNEASAYVLFEGVTSQKILGCLFTVNKKKITDAEWTQLWSEN